MRTRKMTFQEVKVSATHRWTDENGKKRQKTRSFAQTINPFNRNDDGTVKTYTQIMDEITKERDEWLAEMKGKKEAK